MSDDATLPAPPSVACPRCRTTPREGRLTMGYAMRRIGRDLFDLGEGLLRTARELVRAPRRVTQAFIDGDDLRFYSPAKFFAVAMAASVLLTSAPILDGIVAESLSSVTRQPSAATRAWVEDWNGLLYAPLVFVLALVNRRVFRAAGYNYAEHLVTAAYGWGQVVLIVTVATLGGHLVPLAVLGVAYWVWFCAHVFGRRPLGAIVGSLAGLAVALLGYLVLLDLGASMLAPLVETLS